MRVAVDRRNDRLAHPRHRLSQINEGTRKFETAGAGRPRAVIVPTEAERVAVTGQDASTDAGRLPHVFQHRDDLFSHFLGDAIAVVGALHADDLYASLALNRDLRRCHVSSPLPGRSSLAGLTPARRCQDFCYWPLTS